jgi:hypothetical protein
MAVHWSLRDPQRSPIRWWRSRTDWVLDVHYGRGARMGYIRLLLSPYGEDDASLRHRRRPPMPKLQQDHAMAVRELYVVP